MKSAVFIIAAALSLAAAPATQVAGVGNFEKLNDHVYRGAQPTEQGFQSLAKMGIQTIIDLQPYGDARSHAEENWVKSAGMKYVNIPLKEMQTPSDEHVQQILALLENESTGPVFIHCHRGADRTGGMIACYRMEHDHWDSTKALAEARDMGMSWYQKAIQHYVKGFQPHPAGNSGAVMANATPAPAAQNTIAPLATMIP
jgi:protein tyrosine/serine phosphatase